MAKKTSTTSKKIPQTRNIKLSDGTIIKTDDSRKQMVKNQGVKILNKEIPDPEEILPSPEDPATAHKYPPPKKDPVFREKWMRFIDNVCARENFKIAHLELLEVLCDLYSDLEHLNKFIRMNGMSFKVVTVTGEGRRMYPEVTQRDKIRAQIQQYSRHLDLFPKKDKSLKGMDPNEDSEWG